MSLSEKDLVDLALAGDLVDLALAGLRSSYREKLDGSSFCSINQLQGRALSQETKFNSDRSDRSLVLLAGDLIFVIRAF